MLLELTREILVEAAISSNFYTPIIRNGEIRMMKYLYVAITIMTDDVLVLWRGREGVFALSRMLI